MANRPTQHGLNACCVFISRVGNGAVFVQKVMKVRSYAIRYEMLFNVQSKADMTQLNLPHGTNNEKWKTKTDKLQTRSSAIAEGPRDASCQLKYCQLPRNSAETTYTTSPHQIDGMKLEI